MNITLGVTYLCEGINSFEYYKCERIIYIGSKNVYYLTISSTSTSFKEWK